MFGTGRQYRGWSASLCFLMKRAFHLLPPLLIIILVGTTERAVVWYCWWEMDGIATVVETGFVEKGEAWMGWDEIGSCAIAVDVIGCCSIGNAIPLPYSDWHV